MLLVIGGAAFGVAVTLPWRSDLAPAMRGPELPQDASRHEPSQQPLQRQIEELRARLDRLEQAGNDAVAREAAIPATTKGLTADAASWLAAIDDALRRRDVERFANLDDLTLLRRARWLLEEQGNREDAQRALEALLARPTSVAMRAAASHALGVALQRRGDFLASAQARQTAVDLFGLGSEEGADAARGLIGMLGEMNEWQRALGLADALDLAQPVTTLQRLRDRCTAAQLAQQLGDVERARAEFARVLAEGADVPGAKGLLEEVAGCLQRL